MEREAAQNESAKRRFGESWKAENVGGRAGEGSESISESFSFICRKTQ